MGEDVQALAERATATPAASAAVALDPEPIENHGMANPAQTEKILEAFRLLNGLAIDLVTADIALARESWRSNLRAVVADAEALSSALRELLRGYLLLPDADVEKKLGPRRVARLQEGPTKSTNLYGSLRGALDAAADALGLTRQTDDAHQTHWDDLERLITLRNRITHPKTAADFDCAEPFLTERVRVWLLMLCREPARTIGKTTIYFNDGTS